MSTRDGQDTIDTLTISGHTQINTGNQIDTVNVGSDVRSGVDAVDESGLVDEIGALLIIDGGEQRLLAQVRSASGAKYSDGETTFWTKGDEAIVNLVDENLQRCKARN